MMRPDRAAHPSRPSAAPLAAVLLALAPLAATGAEEAVVPLPNPGFEEELASWRTKEGAVMSTASRDAAREGQFGLRVQDADQAEGSNVISAMFPVTPGNRYRVTFWARTSATPPVAGVFLWLYNERKVLLEGTDRPVAMVAPAGEVWKAHALETVIPDGIAHAALWVHTLSAATGTVDFDDFEIRDLGPAASP